MATTPRSSVQSRPGWSGIHDRSNLPVPGDVLAAMEELGLRIHRVVDIEAVAWCPMHVERIGKEDRHSSWSVLTEDRVLSDGSVIPAGTHNCFSCGYSGAFVDLVADVLKCEWDDAREWVRKRGGIARARKVLERHARTPVVTDTSLQINEASLALTVDPPLEQLTRRNLHLASALHYGVRWDNTKDCWILPIRDPDRGTLWGWQEKNERYFRNRPKDVHKSKTLFGYREFEGDTAVLVESPLDVVRLHSVGVTGGVSSFGAKVSDTQMSLVLDVADTVVIALDADSAGDQANRKILKDWVRRGLVVRFLNYDGTDAKDVGDMTANQIRQALRTAYASPVATF